MAAAKRKVRATTYKAKRPSADRRDVHAAWGEGPAPPHDRERVGALEVVDGPLGALEPLRHGRLDLPEQRPQDGLHLRQYRLAQYRPTGGQRLTAKETPGLFGKAIGELLGRR